MSGENSSGRADQPFGYTVDTKRKVISFVLFQAVWFAVMLLPPFAYVPLVLGFFIIHIAWIVPYRRVWLWVVRISVLGWLLDSMLLHMGVFDFASDTVIPFWLLSLWTMFAFVLMTSVIAFSRYLLALALVSAISGPLTYYAGVQLKYGANLNEPVLMSLLFISVAWGLFVPFILALVNRDSQLKTTQQPVQFAILKKRAEQV